MMTTWKLQDAKARFNQIGEDAMKIGLHCVPRRGQKSVVILSVDEYEKLASNEPALKKFLLSCSKIDKDPTRVNI
ncbi:MAG: type II toxin-antitoxin system Phd/YefM family antitoxin [Proteobacteria bacterium]|nr:type II toxin-antitoxin system Phd/YefM family antitoxin [Pseudomonadota bacterium]